jgi:threonyl-tRNA synthetase
MAEIDVSFPDGSKVTVPAGTSVAEALEAHDPKSAEGAVAAKVNGELIDLFRPLEESTSLSPVTFGDPEGAEIYRHSASHILAQAVKRLWPEAQYSIGPAIEDGFYYDFDREEPFTPEELETIEAEMRRIIEEDQPVSREVLERKEAIELFRKIDETYKVEILEDMDDPSVTVYRQGEFVDLCRGPHLPSTSAVKAVKLLSVAGAYWRGYEGNKMLQRIYGTSFPTEEALEAYLASIEEARKRDHRVLGRQLDIFSVQDAAGGGLIYWHPKGTIIRKVIERFWEDEHVRRGYQLVTVPHLVRDRVFKTSGHYDFYRENMYVLNIDEDEYVVKPMNCPGHIMIYQSHLRSYRELPIRYAEMGTVYRYERSGTLHGMLRVRGFTQDDAHIFCTPDQLRDEVMGVIDLALFMLSTFGYEDYELDLSVRDPAHPENYAGSEAEWTMAEEALAKALAVKGMEAERQEGEAVFYGPKIDIKMLDALGRGWQGPTIQFDFNLPKRFDIEYIGPDGAAHNVVMVHRTVLGSMERFIGGLVEHYAGAFPLWLAPVQARVMTITDAQNAYAQELKAALEGAGLRADADLRNEKIGYKVREAQMEKIPYMAIVGNQEVRDRTVSVRTRGGRDIRGIEVERLSTVLQKEATSRSLTSLLEEDH